MKFRDIVELALLYIGIPAITLYPLGFLALGIQMWRDPFFPYYDFAAVWNAVSVVHHTIVIGTGVELLYLSIISTLLGVGIASLTFHFLRRSPDEETHRPRRSLWGPLSARPPADRDRDGAQRPHSGQPGRSMAGARFLRVLRRRGSPDRVREGPG